jgi:hypothetical protein
MLFSIRARLRSQVGNRTREVFSLGLPLDGTSKQPHSICQSQYITPVYITVMLSLANAVTVWSITFNFHHDWYAAFPGQSLHILRMRPGS